MSDIPIGSPGLTSIAYLSPRHSTTQQNSPAPLRSPNLIACSTVSNGTTSARCPNPTPRSIFFYAH